jgi:hypothetical protein
MPTEEGGGASRTTDPASGTSAATDVSLREYLNIRIDALDRHLTYELASLRREASAAHQNSEQAINVAAQEAKERLMAHNGLIDQMQEQATHYASRESQEALRDKLEASVDDAKLSFNYRLSRLENWQAKMVGGIGVVAAIGIANLVKVWTG